MLLRFRDGQQDFAQRFAAAQQHTDAGAAARLAHTLKGLAGNIGALGVQAAAGDLEAACLASRTLAIPGALARVTQALKPVLDGLEDLRGPNEHSEAAAGAQAPDEQSGDEDLALELARLQTLLQASDIEAASVLDALLLRLQGTAKADRLAPLASAMAEFDFEEALQHLQDVLAEMEPPARK